MTKSTMTIINSSNGYKNHIFGSQHNLKIQQSLSENVSSTPKILTVHLHWLSGPNVMCNTVYVYDSIPCGSALNHRYLWCTCAILTEIPIFSIFIESSVTIIPAHSCWALTFRISVCTRTRGFHILSYSQTPKYRLFLYYRFVSKLSFLVFTSIHRYCYR